MTIFYAPRVWEVGTITGAGPYNVPGAAYTGPYQTFAASGIASGATVWVNIQDTETNSWELSLFTYTAGSPGILTRLQFGWSSTGAAITFAGNSCNIAIDIPPPGVESAGAASAGLIPALGPSGVIDASVLGQVPGAPYYIPGMWYDNASAGGVAFSARTSTYVYSPIYVAADHTFTGLATYCMTAPTAAFTMRLGVYLDNGAGAPGELAIDAGNVSVSAAGPYALTGLSFLLPRGYNWLCLGTPSTLNSGAMIGISQSAQGSDITCLTGKTTPFEYRQSGYYLENLAAGGYAGGALPATAPTPNVSTYGNAGSYAGALLA
jgi:hypothetical protein